jgi:uncharacterized protein (TIGR02301 family)
VIHALFALALVAADWLPAERQAAADLAYALGEMHALSLTCVGEGDQTWRERMNRLLQYEAPAPGADDPDRRSLVERFNAGFSVRKAEFPACTPEAEADRQATARRGLSLSRRLAGE